MSQQLLDEAKTRAVLAFFDLLQKPEEWVVPAGCAAWEKSGRIEAGPFELSWDAEDSPPYVSVSLVLDDDGLERGHYEFLQVGSEGERRIWDFIHSAFPLEEPKKKARLAERYHKTLDAFEKGE